MIKFFKLHECGYGSYAPEAILMVEGEENIAIAREYITRTTNEMMAEDPDIISEKIVEYIENHGIGHLIDSDSFDIYL